MTMAAHCLTVLDEHCLFFYLVFSLLAVSTELSKSQMQLDPVAEPWLSGSGVVNQEFESQFVIHN